MRKFILLFFALSIFSINFTQLPATDALVSIKADKRVGRFFYTIICVLCLLVVLLFNSNTVFSQSCANYAVTRTTGVTYTTIAGTGTSDFIWRNTISNQNDDNRSYAVSIGFDFWYLGVRYTNITASLNGTLDFSASTEDGNSLGVQPYGGNYNNWFSTANGTQLALAPMYDDLWTGGGGTAPAATSLVYKVSGYAPNRVLTVEWLNFDKWPSSTGSLNFQVKIYESTGIIEFVYGTMTAGTEAIVYACGINNTWAAGGPTAALLLTQQTANTTTFSSIAQNALATVPASNSRLTFTPPTPTAAPTGLSFTDVMQTGMTLNWTDNASNENGYVIYNSTDGVNYSFVTQIAASSVSVVITGLLLRHTYFWQVYAVTEGNLGTALTGSQATLPAGTITSIITGNWSNPTTWDCSCVPTAGDSVIIANGTNVILNSTGACNKLSVGQGISGQLTFGNSSSNQTLTVNTDVTVNAGAVMTTGAFVATHTITIGGNLTNNGTIDLVPGAGQVCNVIFNKNGNQNISGAGATTNFNLITLNMGTSNANVLDITSANFTTPANFLTLTNGTFKLSTEATVTPFTGAVTIPLSAGIWMNNAGATMSMGATVTLYGYVRATAGILNIGDATDENLTSYGGTITIDGGTMNIAGRLDGGGVTILTYFTITSGTLTVATVGSTTAGLAPFMISETGSTFNMSGGTIIIEKPGAGNLGYVNTGGTVGTVSGGTLQMGDTSTPAAQTMFINSGSPVYNLVVSNGVAVTAQLSSNLKVQNNVTINSGTFDMIAFNANRTVTGGTFSLAASSILKLSGTTGGASINNNFPNNFSTITLNQASTVEYYGATQTIYNTPTYGNLTITAEGNTTAGGNLIIAGNLLINSGIFAGSTFSHTIAGNWTNNGTYIASTGTVTFNGTSPLTLSGAQKTTFNNLTLSNSNGLALSQNVDLLNAFSFGVSNATLATNGFLTIKSSATNTGWITDITNNGSNTGNDITGDVTVERYFSARKAWRFLSIPTNTTQTVQQTWQEGGTSNGSNPVAGYGIQITGAGGPAAGFDLYSATPSMKTYNPATNSWVGIANTNTATIKATDGYMTFIRGDRTANAFNSVPTQTVLRTKGSLYTGDQTPIPVSAGKFASIGNPYASSLDMHFITKTGLKDFFYIWDPNLGGSSGLGAYQTFSYNGGDYVITPGMGSYGGSGSVSNYIESGQAFFVQATGTGGSLTFKETAKSSGTFLVSAVAGLPQPQLRASLYGVNADNSPYMIDGALINYDDSYSNTVDDMDAIKSTNVSENLSIKTANTLLVIERRHTILSQDTIFLNLTGTKVQKYRFEFTADQLDRTGLTGFLEDTYLHTSTPLNLSGSTIADFNIVNIPGSYATDRFRIVFTPALVLPLSFTSVKAYQKNKDIAVEWKVENESNLKQYNVEKSFDGNHYAIANTVAASNAALSNYSWLDVHPSEGYNYYRIRSTDVNGKTEYSTVVKVLMGKQKQSISIYPNPVINGLINLQLTNEPEGNYGIRILNKIGEVMISKQINHAGSSSRETIQLDKYSAHGIYQLEVTKPDGNAININVIY